MNKAVRHEWTEYTYIYIDFKYFWNDTHGKP